MQKANYTNTSTTSGGQGKYPLSTQTLDFIQQQVMILQLLGYIGGSKYILRQPDGTSTGLVFIDGEVLTLAAKPIPSANIRYINVTTKRTLKQTARPTPRRVSIVPPLSHRQPAVNPTSTASLRYWRPTRRSARKSNKCRRRCSTIWRTYWQRKCHY